MQGRAEQGDRCTNSGMALDSITTPLRRLNSD
jgi:hypothetical protein